MLNLWTPQELAARKRCYEQHEAKFVTLYGSATNAGGGTGGIEMLLAQFTADMDYFIPHISMMLSAGHWYSGEAFTTSIEQGIAQVELNNFDGLIQSIIVSPPGAVDGVNYAALSLMFVKGYVCPAISQEYKFEPYGLIVRRGGSLYLRGVMSDGSFQDRMDCYCRLMLIPLFI